MNARAALHEDRESDRGHHECNRAPGGHLREYVACCARAKGGLRALTSECSGEIGALALLQEDDADQKDADENVNDGKEDNKHIETSVRREERQPS